MDVVGLPDDSRQPDVIAIVRMNMVSIAFVLMLLTPECLIVSTP